MKIKNPEELTISNINNDEEDCYYFDGTNLYRGDFLVQCEPSDQYFEL